MASLALSINEKKGLLCSAPEVALPSPGWMHHPSASKGSAGISASRRAQQIAARWGSGDFSHPSVPALAVLFHKALCPSCGAWAPVSSSHGGHGGLWIS